MDAWCLSCIRLVLHKVCTRKSNTVEWLSSSSMVRILSSNRLFIANHVAVFHCLFDSYIPKTHTAHLVHTRKLTCWHCMFPSTCSLPCIYTLMLLHTCPFDIFFCNELGQMLHHNQACTYCSVFSHFSGDWPGSGRDIIGIGNSPADVADRMTIGLVMGRPTVKFKWPPVGRQWGWWANGAANMASSSNNQSADSGIGGLMGQPTVGLMG